MKGVLIAGGQSADRERLRKLVEGRLNARVGVVEDGIAALAALATGGYGILVTDWTLPGLGGAQLIAEVRRRYPSPAVVVLAAGTGVREAVEAMRLGASDFLDDPSDDGAVLRAVGAVLRSETLPGEAVYRTAEALNGVPSPLLGDSPAMREVARRVGLVAGRSTTVLLEGESGTGKEVAARALHSASRGGAPGRFVAVNCAAVPEGLVASELFGHERGSYTGAVGQRLGRVELAHGGTLFLDEVTYIPLQAQAALLRVLQERSFERVGGSETVRVDVRVIAATVQPLADLIADGRFLRELHYRLSVFKIRLPPLRDRREDIPALASFFATKYSPPGFPKAVSPAALAALQGYPWPGNVRELENAIEHACVVAAGDPIGPGDLPDEVRVTRPAAGRGRRK